MEAAFAGPTSGTVARVAIAGVSPVDGGDLVVVIDPHDLNSEPEGRIS
jgi:pyruvate carboxylase